MGHDWGPAVPMRPSLANLGAPAASAATRHGSHLWAMRPRNTGWAQKPSYVRPIKLLFQQGKTAVRRCCAGPARLIARQDLPHIRCPEHSCRPHAPASAGPEQPTPSCMLICMQSTSVRVDGETHDELKRLADELGTTVGRTVSLAVRALRQDRVGEQLAQPLRADETAWLDADLG
jgi:predicted transcriptional regulator